MENQKVEIKFIVEDSGIGTWVLIVIEENGTSLTVTDYMPRDLYTPMTELVRCARKSLSFWDYDVPETFIVRKPTSVKEVSSYMPKLKRDLKNKEVVKKG